MPSIRTYSTFPQGVAIEVISYHSSLYVPVAFNDPKAYLVELKDENGQSYEMVKDSHPTLCNPEWRCFNLSRAIPQGVHFTGVIMSDSQQHSFHGEAVDWQPTFGTALSAEDLPAPTSKSPLPWLAALVAAVFILGISFFLFHNHSIEKTPMPPSNPESTEQDSEPQSDQSSSPDTSKTEEIQTTIFKPNPPTPVSGEPTVRPQPSASAPSTDSSPTPKQTPPSLSQQNPPATTSFPTQNPPSTNPFPTQNPPSTTSFPTQNPTTKNSLSTQSQPQKLSFSPPRSLPRPTSYTPLSLAQLSDNGIYTLTNAADVNDLDRIANSGKRNITLVFCPDRYSTSLSPTQYADLWNKTISKISSYNVSKVQVLKGKMDTPNGDLLKRKDIGFSEE